MCRRSRARQRCQAVSVWLTESDTDTVSWFTFIVLTQKTKCQALLLVQAFLSTGVKWRQSCVLQSSCEHTLNRCKRSLTTNKMLMARDSYCIRILDWAFTSVEISWRKLWRSLSLSETRFSRKTEPCHTGVGFWSVSDRHIYTQARWWKKNGFGLPMSHKNYDLKKMDS